MVNNYYSENKITGHGKCLSIPFIMSLMNNRGQQHKYVTYHSDGSKTESEHTIIKII